MKILLSAVSSATRPDGVTRHTVNLTRGLLARPDIQRLDLVAGPWQLDLLAGLLDLRHPRLRLHAAKSGSTSLARNAWYLVGLPRLARRLHSDLVQLTYPAPILRGRFPCPIIVSLHDLFPIDIPRNFGFPRVLLNRVILHQCLRSAAAIACVSKSTLERLLRWHPALASKASHIDNSVEAPADLRLIAIPQLGNRPFLLCVAQHRRNKNIPLTLEIFKRLRTDRPDLLLCLVGREGPETHAIHTLIAALSLQSSVLLLSGISDQHLQWCYRHAKLLVATSSVEGFGLPIAEALLAGCPVLCSDIPAFREIGTHSCHYAPLLAPAFAREARHMLDHPRPAPVALPRLSAATVSSQYVSLYQRLLSPTPHVPPTLVRQNVGAL